MDLTDDFGIAAPPDTAPFVFASGDVAGGGSISFRSALAGWDAMLADVLQREAKNPAIDPETATVDSIRARRLRQVAELAGRVSSLVIAGTDRTARGDAFLVQLAEKRPDVFDRVYIHAMKIDAAAMPPTVDVEPIAGNS